MAQKPMLRGEVGARVLVIRACADMPSWSQRNLALKLAGVVSLRERLCLRCRTRGPRDLPPLSPLSAFSHALEYLAREGSALSALWI